MQLKKKNILQAKEEFCIPYIRLNTRINLVSSKLNSSLLHKETPCCFWFVCYLRHEINIGEKMMCPCVISVDPLRSIWSVNVGF